MSESFAEYQRVVEAQREQILECLARLGLDAQFDAAIPDPEPRSPLAALLIGVRIVAEQLAMLSRQRDRIEAELRDKLETIERQNQAITLQTRAILELSTPVIQVWEDILVLPLIGAIDTTRAQQVMANLLEAVARSHAAVVIIDITGVPVVDTRVANHLIKTAQATRLLGAEVVLTGVSPTNAQTLVRLGVDLGRLATRSSLQAGLRLAFATTHQKVGKDTSP